MIVGDLVKYRDSDPMLDDSIGIVVSVDDSNRQTSAEVLFSKGLKVKIWEKHLEVVISETS